MCRKWQIKVSDSVNSQKKPFFNCFGCLGCLWSGPYMRKQPQNVKKHCCASISTLLTRLAPPGPIILSQKGPMQPRPSAHTVCPSYGLLKRHFGVEEACKHHDSPSFIITMRPLEAIHSLQTSHTHSKPDRLVIFGTEILALKIGGRWVFSKTDWGLSRMVKTAFLPRLATVGPLVLLWGPPLP